MTETICGSPSNIKIAFIQRNVFIVIFDRLSLLHETNKLDKFEVHVATLVHLPGKRYVDLVMLAFDLLMCNSSTCVTS